MGDLKQLQLSQIRENPVALRAVNRQGEQYKGLCDSIKSKGFLGAVTVREKVDPATEETYYELVDGLHRFSACKDVGLTTINVDVTDLDDDDVLKVQLMANEHRVATRPVEMSQQLRRILSRNPLMTEASLAAELGKSPKWIQDRLGLNKIENAKIQTLINEGKIKLANAYTLAKLPPEEQINYVDTAMQDQPDEFLPKVNKRVKEIKDAKRQGRDTSKTEFEPVAFLQKVKDIKTEHETHEAGAASIAQQGLQSAQDGWNAAIAWILHLDPVSVDDQKAKHDQRLADRAEAKKSQSVKQAQKRAKDYEKKAAAAKEEAAKAQAEAAAQA